MILSLVNSGMNCKWRWRPLGGSSKFQVSSKSVGGVWRCIYSVSITNISYNKI